MEAGTKTRCTAFVGTRRIGSGVLGEVAAKAKEVFDDDPGDPVLVFDDLTGRPIELDYRGDVAEVVQRIADREAEIEPSVAVEPELVVARGRGRPKLGVVAREVTLLPRHWDWLNGQPGGASVALRKLVEEARRSSEGRDQIRQSQEAAYRFMSALAGNLAGFEEATRALFRGDRPCFVEQMATWPADVRDYSLTLASIAIGAT
jgi:hypothetical protein